MNEVEVLEQLYDLISDRKVFIDENQNDCSVFKKDIIALETIIENYKHNEICLNGYRESILRSSDNNLDLVEDVLIQNQKLKQENERLKEQLKQRDEVIDEVSKLLEYYYIGNLKYDKESQRAFERIFDFLNKYKGDNNE